MTQGPTLNSFSSLSPLRLSFPFHLHLVFLTFRFLCKKPTARFGRILSGLFRLPVNPTSPFIVKGAWRGRFSKGKKKWAKLFNEKSMQLRSANNIQSQFASEKSKGLNLMYVVDIDEYRCEMGVTRSNARKGHVAKVLL